MCLHTEYALWTVGCCSNMYRSSACVVTYRRKEEKHSLKPGDNDKPVFAADKYVHARVQCSPASE